MNNFRLKLPLGSLLCAWRGQAGHEWLRAWCVKSTPRLVSLEHSGLLFLLELPQGFPCRFVIRRPSHGKSGQRRNA